MGLSKLTNWGNYPVALANEIKFTTPDSVKQALLCKPVIARGAGRCYGDASLAENVLNTLPHNSFLAFDAITGILRCEAGVMLSDILEVCVPQGWFLPVTPGTKFVTVGGAIASDVHGKNHHKDGSFRNFVIEMRLMLADGSIIQCSPTENTDLFEATCGGVGLTGIILEATLQLVKVESSYINLTQHKAVNLEEVFALFRENAHYTYSVAWIDCLQKGKDLGRSILLLGEHSKLEDLPAKTQSHALSVPAKMPLKVPVDFPQFALNKYSVKAFNYAYYNKARKKYAEAITDYNSYFYPLDFVHDWNKIYGARGFVQYQFVLPLSASFEGLTAILKRIEEKGMGSFLAVLKLFGKQNSLFSFPMEGYTLALDFPVQKGLFEFLNTLDEMVHERGGRVYLTKDARLSKENFEKGYPNFREFISVVHKYNGESSPFRSMLSDRLMPEI